MTGHDLKVQRVMFGLKQIELAARTGIPRERLSRFENGWQLLPPEELERIREVLDEIRAGRQGEAGGPLYAREGHL